MGKINPRVNLAFKKIFGIEENKDLLISLINSTVGPENQVIDVILLNPYNQKNFKQDKLSILDIKAKGTCGKKFNIEIQITDAADYDKRALYYWAKLYTEQLRSGEDYSELEKVIGIHILNFISILDSDKYHNSFHITEKETGSPYFRNVELHTVELKKFAEKAGGELGELAAQIKNSLDIWSAFLTRHDLLSSGTLPESLDVPELKKALKVLNVMNFTDEEREAYEDRLKWLRIETNTLKKYEEKGYEEGLKKGREERLEKRRKEEKLTIAKSMLENDISPMKVAEMTGLRIEDVQALKQAKAKKK